MSGSGSGEERQDGEPGQASDDAGEDRLVTLADIGETPRGQGQDRQGGYGGAPVPQEPGPDQDEGLNN